MASNLTKSKGQAFVNLKGLLLICFFVFIAGCEKDRVYKNIYDGMEKREQILNRTDEPIPQEQATYDQYKKEREKSLKTEDEEK